jgi:hypothetical protein
MLSALDLEQMGDTRGKPLAQMMFLGQRGCF